MSQKIIILTSIFTKGLYYIRIESENQLQTIKLIKE